MEVWMPLFSRFRKNDKIKNPMSQTEVNPKVWTKNFGVYFTLMGFFI